MTTPLLCFAATFVSVFALGLQSQNVNQGHYWAAAWTSLLIGAGHIGLYKYMPNANVPELAGYLLGGVTGITTSMWFHRSVKAWWSARTRVSQFKPVPCAAKRHPISAGTSSARATTPTTFTEGKTMNAPVAEIRLAEGALELLPLSAIAPSETAAQARRRKRYTPAALDELAASIRAVGVMQPVVVRKLTALRGLAAYELVAGERRWLASEKAGVAHVPAIVREDITDADLVALQYIENKQRETIDPLQEAETFRDLMEGAEGKSAEDLAELLGVSRAHVYNRRKLLNLQPVVLDALEAGRIDHTKALRISRTPAAKLQRKALEKALETDHRGNQVSDRELGEWMRDRLMVRLDRAPFDLDDPNMLSKKPGMFACQKSALHNLPPCTACENCSKSDPDFDAEIQAAHGDGAIVCADKPCHDAKVQYFFFRKLERARAEGRTIIEGDEARAIKPWPLAGELRGYIDLDAQAYGAQPPAHLTLSLIHI